MILIMPGGFIDHPRYLAADIVSLQIPLMNQRTNLTGVGQDQSFNDRFKVKGAMPFFALLVLLCLIIWFGIYFMM